MVRTLSARLRRSFAQREWGVVFRQGERFAPTAFVAATMVQILLLLGLVLLMTLYPAGGRADLAQLLGVLALLTSAVIGYAIFSAGDSSKQEEPADFGVGSSSLVPAHTPQISSYASDNADELARLRARVSHELRTPLNAVIGFSEMMHREVLGPVGHERYREYAAHIRNSAERFQIATESTLAVTELLTSPRALKRVPVNLKNTVEQTLAEFRLATGSDEPDWLIDVESTLLVESDASGLGDALGHIWMAGRSLALSANLEPLPHCRVSCHRVSAASVELRFDIDVCDASNLIEGSELAPGAELSLFLARLSVEAAGGTVAFSYGQDGSWQARVRLSLANQHELFGS